MLYPNYPNLTLIFLLRSLFYIGPRINYFVLTWKVQIYGCKTLRRNYYVEPVFIEVICLIIYL